MEPTNDEITRRIGDRLGERQRKLKRMKEMERKPRVIAWRSAAMVAIAASVVAAFLLMPVFRTNSPLEELGIQPGFSEEYRAALPEMAEINDHIMEQEYEIALQKTRRALRNSDLVLKECDGLGETMDDEEMAYEYEVEHVVNGELRWTYIFLLTSTGHTDEAIKQTHIYLKRKKGCQHEEQARELLKLLKNRKKFKI